MIFYQLSMIKHRIIIYIVNYSQAFWPGYYNTFRVFFSIILNQPLLPMKIIFAIIQQDITLYTILKTVSIENNRFFISFK